MAITIEDIEELNAAGLLTEENYKKATAALLGTSDAASKLIPNLKQLATENNFLSEAMSSAYSSLNNIVENASRSLSESSSETQDKLVQTATMLGTVMMPQLTQNSASFKGFGDAGLDSSQRVTEAFDKLTPMFNKMGIAPALQAGIKEMFRMQEASQELKVSIFNLMQQSGSVAPLMNEGALSMDTLSESAANMNQRMDEMGKSLGINRDALPDLISKFSKVPGALDMVSKGGVQSADSLDSLVKTLTVASGLSIDHSDFIKRQSESYFNWGTAIDKTMDNLTLMNKTQQDLGMNRDVMLKFLDDATAGTNKFGDSTESAIMLMGSFGKAMRESGVSERGVSEIISGMSGRMKDLDLGQAAFINQTSGGKGGLAGAYEIEFMKQQGDFAGIAQKAMDAFDNMGMGETVTLQDVQDNDALAPELARQTAILQKLGLAGDNQEAYRMLEAMQSGALDDLKNIINDPAANEADARQRMIEVMESGNEIQKSGNDAVINFTNSLEKLATTNALNIDAGIQGLDSFTNSEKDRGVAGPITGVFDSTAINARTGDSMESQLERTTIRQGTKDTYDSKIVEEGMENFMGALQTLIEKLPEEVRGNTAFKAVEKFISPVKSSREMAEEGVSQASRSPNIDPSQQRSAIDGKLQLEIVLTDEERNLIATRDFAEAWKKLANQKTGNSGPNPFSGAPNQ